MSHHIEPINRGEFQQMHRQANILLNWIRKPRNALAIIAIVAFCTIYLSLAVTPSSYAVGMRLLGQPTKGLLAGTPEPIRSDEWMVFTPYVQIAVNSGFQTHDRISPYHEALRSFFPLPIADWAAVFKPYYLAFTVLPPANAFSFYYLFNMTAFIVGWALFFRKLRLDPKLAIAGSLLLFFSQFVQVWWTSNAGAFAIAPWVAVAWMAIEKRWARVLVCAYALTVWLLADTYPPFLYSCSIAMLIATLAMRPELFCPRGIIDAAIAAGLAALVFMAYFGHLITTMGATVYPGNRVASGGGVEPAKLLAHFYPFALTNHYEPLAIFHGTNACEIAVVGSLLPIFCLVFMDYSRFIIVLRENKRPLAILFAGIVFTAIWIFVPLSSSIGKWVGLTYVPSNRLLLAFGWLVSIFFLFLLQRCTCKYAVIRICTFALAMLVVILIKYKLSGGPWKDAISYFDYLPLVAALALAVASVFKKAHGWGLLLAIAVLMNAVTFGSFNPIQSAYAIFSMNKASVLAHLKAAGAQMDADGILSIPGDYGALINGVGIPSFNTVLLSPQKVFFSSHFPDVPTSELNFVFNRYAHVSFNRDNQLEVLQADLISLPISRFAGTPTSTRLQPLYITTSYCSLDAINAVPATKAPNLKVGNPATFAGWFATTSKQSISSFMVHLEGTYPFSFSGQDVAPRPDVVEAIHGDAAANYGFVAVTDFRGARPGTYTVVLFAPNGERCPTGVKVTLIR